MPATRSAFLSAILLPTLLLLALAAGPVFAGDDASPGGAAATPAKDPIVGTWWILTAFRGQERTSRLTIERGEDGTLKGSYFDSSGATTMLDDVAFEAGKLTFKRTSGARTIRFEGTIVGGVLKGKHLLMGMQIPASGVRGKKAFDELTAAHHKANERGSDLEADYDRHAHRALKRDGFPVLTNPKMLGVAEATDLLDGEPVLGVVVAGEAKAYPISIMGVHELVNDTCGGQPIAASW